VVNIGISGEPSDGQDFGARVLLPVEANGIIVARKVSPEQVEEVHGIGSTGVEIWNDQEENE